MYPASKLGFMEYGIFDDEEGLVGIKSDAPDWAKKEYIEFIEVKEDAKKKGIKV